MVSRCVNGKQLVYRAGTKICGIQNHWPNIPESSRTMTRERTCMDKSTYTQTHARIVAVSRLISVVGYFQMLSMKEPKTNEKSNHHPIWQALKSSVHEHEPSRTSDWWSECDTITEKETSLCVQYLFSLYGFCSMYLEGTFPGWALGFSPPLFPTQSSQEALCSGSRPRGTQIQHSGPWETSLHSSAWRPSPSEVLTALASL